MYECSKSDVQPSSSPIINSEGEGEENDIMTIDSLLKPFYDSFIEEMLSRGRDLSQIPISIVFINPGSQNGAGNAYCGLGYANYDQSNTARVEIVSSPDCWNNQTYIQKENLMYHEFGHALLNRGHVFNFFPNGLPTSIMCSQICSNFQVYSLNQEQQRSFYLDELLNEDIEMPSWADEKNYSQTLVVDEILENNEWVPVTVFDNNVSDNPYSYFIEQIEYTSPNYSLGISVIQNSNNNNFGNWYKDFEISDFANCSNLVAEVNIKSTDFLINGNINLVIDLYDDLDSDEEFSRRFAQGEAIELGGGFFKIQTKSICIPEVTKKFRVRFYVKGDSETNVYFDDLVVNLYE
ncbi:MAG: hypothetical protein EVB11_00845 [Winogradskyella sp.]|nr:MAG: hypothetical protein EVB11_00845 [Winogradskyella sp.]